MELIKTARAMLTEELGLLEGCRKIAALRLETPDVESPLFDTFRAVASETDHLPIGDVRKLASSAHLRRADQEASEYLMRATPRILSACESLISAMSLRH